MKAGQKKLKSNKPYLIHRSNDLSHRDESNQNLKELAKGLACLNELAEPYFKINFESKCNHTIIAAK